jgi:hypothetical protein
MSVTPSTTSFPRHPVILDCGEREAMKAAFHAAALSLGVVMGTYNAAAWIVRRQRHLFVNAWVYAVFATWEGRLVAHHLRQVTVGRPPAKAA